MKKPVHFAKTRARRKSPIGKTESVRLQGFSLLGKTGGVVDVWSALHKKHHFGKIGFLFFNADEIMKSRARGKSKKKQQ